MEFPEMYRVLRITEQALEQARTYAKLVVETVGPYECMGYLAGDAGGQVIDRVLFASHQQVTPSSVEVNGHGVLEAGREIRKLGKCPKGWWHSHANLPVFQSGIDRENTREVLAQIAESNQIILKREQPVTLSAEDGQLSIVQGHSILGLHVENPDVMLQFLTGRIQMWQHIPVGMAYSLVVNAHGDAPHAELYTRTWCAECETIHIDQFAVPIEVIPTVDKASMRDEIKQKVFPARPTLRGQEERLPCKLAFWQKPH